MSKAKEEPTTALVSNPQVLISRMIETKCDPDSLKKMMDIYERWAATQALVAYNAAMTDCQQKMPAVIKNVVHGGTKKPYADLEAVNEKIKPVYTDAGFSVCFTEASGAPAGHIRVTATLSHEAGHVAPPFWLDIPLDKGGAQMNPTQAKGSTISYARRYLLHMIFNLTISGEDKDGQTPFEAITDDQVAFVNDLIEKITTRRPGDDIYKRVMAFARPDLDEIGTPGNLADMPRDKFGRCVDILNKKLDAIKKNDAATKGDAHEGGA